VSKSPIKEWRCHDCGAIGCEVGKDAARAAFEAHWLDDHQTIPWLDDSEPSLDAS
jgi:hypothetical protein